MAIERRGLFLTVCISLGVAAIVFAFLPGPWPNPLPQGPIGNLRAVERLRSAVAAVDAACSAGDVGAFDAATTTAMREQLSGRLLASERQLDTTTLRELATATPQGPWFDQRLLAGEVHGARAAIAVQRPQGDGAQVLSFWWDGQHLRFDGSHHEVRVNDEAAARAVVRDAVMTRDR